mgnify:CR=1 FL=1
MTSEIKADKWSPASGTAGTIGDSGDTFTLTAGANLTLGGASTTVSVPSGATLDVASGATFDATGATVTGISGGLVPVGQVNGGSAAAVNLDSIFSATYKNYIIIVDKLVPDSGGASVYMQFRDESGDLGGSNYGYSARSLNADTGGEDNTDNDGHTLARFEGSGVAGDANKLGMRMVMNVQDPYTSTVYTGWHGTFGFINNSGYVNSGYFGGLYHDNDSVRGIKLYLNTGGNLTATIRAYGVVNS